jgi:hypothetical protein
MFRTNATSSNFKILHALYLNINNVKCEISTKKIKTLRRSDEISVEEEEEIQTNDALPHFKISRA